MSFESEKARRFLLEHGYVFTFRTKKRELEPVWINEGRGKPKVADGRIVWRLPIGKYPRLSKNDMLQIFYEGSGFESPMEWLDEIIRLNGRLPSKGWIYLVLLDSGDKNEDEVYS